MALTSGQDQKVCPKEEGKKRQCSPEKVAGPSGIEHPQNKPNCIEVKPEFQEDIDTEIQEDSDENDDSDFDEIKEENSDSEESICIEENELMESSQEDNSEEITKKYQSIFVKSYTSVTVKEEPIENVKSIFKESCLEFEKQKYHQQIFEQILKNSKHFSKLKDLQAQYIAELRETAGIEVFTCSLCNYQTMNMTNLNCHFVAIHKGLMEHEVFKCVKCDYETNSQSTVRKHLSTFHKSLEKRKNKYKEDKKEKYPCAECNYKGRTEDGLQRHTKSAHKSNLSKCDLCSFEAQDKNILKNHKDTHKNGNDFYCYKCPYRNGSKLTLALHLLKEHKIDNEMSKRSKICEVCSLPCTSITKLKRHYLSHVKITELDASQIWKCKEPGCNYQSKTKNNLNLHVRTHRAPEFMCEICGFATKRKESYKWHLETHKKLSEIEWIPCPICPYEARTKRHMYQHMKIGVHDGKNRRHIRKRNLQAEGISIPEKCGKRIGNFYKDATSGKANKKPKRIRKPKNKNQDATLNDAIMSFDELEHAIVVKNKVIS